MMEAPRDSKPFQELMDDLCAAFREGFKASDAQVRAYWDALRDVSIGEVRANVKRLIATATKESPFPRPASLRNRPATVPAQPPSAAQEKAERDGIRNWRELKARDPVAFEIEFRSARAATALAQCDESDPDFEEWSREQRRWQALRYLPRAEQEAAVKRYLGL